MILLAEDDEDDQELIAIAFDKVVPKHRFHITNNGQEALEYLSALPEKSLPCLIMLDLNMPILNGFQTLDALKQDTRYQHIPKVVFTTSDSEEDKAACLARGAKDYVVKPHSMKGIVKTIESLLNYCS